MTITIPRSVRRVAAVVAMSAMVIGATAGAALAATGRVNTAGAPLTVRSGPGTGYSAVGSVADGTTVNISCQALGTSVTGTYGTSRWWDKIGAGRFVSDAYVYTGSDGRVAPYCDGAPGGALGDDYPYPSSKNGQVDKWHFYVGQCTSFVAWRLNDRRHIDFTNYYRGAHFGNADTWDEAARSLGIPVNHTPAVGAVAQWSVAHHHVAWVTRVNSNGTVTIEEYNYTHSEAYDYRTIPASSVEEYIHF
ncbi:MAG: CHAP domain-containing protein [Pseudonocardiales bacterium]